MWKLQIFAPVLDAEIATLLTYEQARAQLVMQKLLFSSLLIVCDMMPTLQF